MSLLSLQLFACIFLLDLVPSCQQALSLSKPLDLAHQLHEWEPFYDGLKLYCDELGRVSLHSLKYSNTSLHVWLMGQRRMWRTGMLSPERCMMLWGVGALRKTRTLWELNFSLLMLCKQHLGSVSLSCKGGDMVAVSAELKKKNLHRWIEKQREGAAKGSLAHRKKELLQSLGIVFERTKHEWQVKFNALCLFKQTFGHIDLASKANCSSSWWSEERLSLSRWLNNQRFQLSKRASKQEADRLRSIGVTSTSRTRFWNKRFNHLVAFKKANGHLRVPIICKENPKLGHWVNNQKQKIRQGRMPQERMKKLESLGLISNRARNSKKTKSVEQ